MPMLNIGVDIRNHAKKHAILPYETLVDHIFYRVEPMQHDATFSPNSKI